MKAGQLPGFFLSGVCVILLFTDFGLEGPYIGQMQGVLLREAPSVPVINLFADAPSFDPHAAAYLLAAYAPEFPGDSVFLCVVDPGVGGRRRPCVVEADGRRFVGPDNGLFNVVASRAEQVRWWDISWRPVRLSASFHGRDLFAPVAARIARGDSVPGEAVDPADRIEPGWPPELAQIIYIDHYGNAITGIRAASVSGRPTLVVGRHRLRWARTFSDVAEGEGFWYENANGLVEISVNRGHAARVLGLSIGDRVHFSGAL